MARLTLKDVPRGMRVTNRRTRAAGVVTSVHIGERPGESRLRIRLDSGRRVDATDDGSGGVRWSAERRSSL